MRLELMTFCLQGKRSTTELKEQKKTKIYSEDKNQPNTSILFYSILFYSIPILFYFILFYCVAVCVFIRKIIINCCIHTKILTYLYNVHLQRSFTTFIYNVHLQRSFTTFIYNVHLQCFK